MTDFPDLKIKALVSFPAIIIDGVGIDTVKQNGGYQFNLAFDDFAPPVSFVTDPANQNALLWNAVTKQYVLAPVSILSSTVSPSIAIPLPNATPGLPGGSLNYAREDHVHPSDLSLYNTTLPLTAAQQAKARQNIGVPASNVIINGDFRINQVGYVSAAALAAGLYGHDQWKAGASGGDYSFTQLKSSTQITIASGKSLIQPIEDANVIGGSYVLSWAGTAQARAGINTLTPSGAYAASPLLITGQTAGTVMSIEFNSGTLGTVKLEIGALATPFIMRPYDQELLTCKRYWQKFTNIIIDTGAASQSCLFSPEFRSTPTVAGGGAGFVFSGDNRVGQFFQTARAYQNLTLDARL